MSVRSSPVGRWGPATLGAFALSLAAAGPLHAGITTVTGTNVGGATYNRPFDNLITLSGVGSDVAYETRTFTVSESGTYSFLSAAGYDNFATLYGGPFDPANPFVNALVANDDAVGSSAAGFQYDLVAGREYTFVGTAYSNGAEGTYGLSVIGPGDVSGLTDTANDDGINFYRGDTTGGPRFNRTFDDFATLSGVGTDVAYDVIDFTVGVSGDYLLATLAQFDSYLFLYTDFDPTNPFLNGIVGNDDGGNVSISGFLASLSAGVNYQLVVTGYGNFDFGEYVLTTVGPDALNISPSGVVPEPGTWALMLLGFGGLGAMLRRTRATALRAT